MKKRFLSIIAAVLLTTLCLVAFSGVFGEKTPASNTTPATLEANYSGDLNIQYNKREIVFSTEPQIFEKEIYVPISELAVALNLYVKLESDRYVILYKNNTFVKLDLESSTAAINGKTYELASGPFYSDQRILAPLLFLADAFHFDSTWEKSTGELSLSDGNLSNQFDFTESDNFYKRVDVADLGVRISVPVHWELLSEKDRSYGFTDDFEYFTMTLSQKRIDASNSLERVEKQIEKDIMRQDPENTQITKVDKVTATRLDSYAIFSDYTPGKKKYKQVTYLFKDKQNAYVLQFRFGGFMDVPQANAIISTIADSFQINQLTIQERDEHYVEFSNFYRLGVKLDTPLYANQTTSDFFVLKGRVEGSAEGFNIKVTKGSQAILFYMPVKNHKFEQKIYVPFGLGKHNIYIEEASRGGLFAKKNELTLFEPIITYDETNVMQFSILNISNNSIRYLIPSSRVPSELEKMSSLANLLTYKEETSYKKSKAAYHWIEQNIEFDTSSAEEILRSPVEVFDNSIGTEEELAYFYATLLRSIDIPCRIVTGNFENSSHFWNEIFINGKWIVADLGEEFANGDGITTYFNLSRDEHYSDYKNIKVLEY